MRRKRHTSWWLAMILVIAMIATAACDSSDDGDGDTSSSGDSASTEEVAALEAELAATQAELEAAQAQVAAPVESQQVIVVGELAPPTQETQVPGDGWATEESVRGGLHLVAQFDSSGPDAWDIAAHPRVYFTSESYASNYFEDTDEGKTLAASEDFKNFAGWHVIDAYTKEVVASALYEYQGNITRGVEYIMGTGWHPIGITHTQDGKYTYVVDGHSSHLYKIDKLLQQYSHYQGEIRGQAIHHIQGWSDLEGNDYVILQWGFGATGGPHHILDPNNNNQVIRSITRQDVNPMGHPFTTPSPDGEYVYVSVGANQIRSNHSPAAGVAVEYIMGTGWHPIGITHTQDGKYTYVVDGHSSHLYKIDNDVDGEGTAAVVDETSAGIAGPYGICLNWDETDAWIDGKGEGTHNVGNSMGIVDLERFAGARDMGNMPFHLGGSASSVDHCALHPDPEVNEIWVSNMKGWETIVINLDSVTVTDYIATPNGGDTHGMAFVWYDNGWESGELMGDMGGPKAASFRAEVLQRAEAAAAADG
jgi:DNA-binding beta-propeller fold protein YncE